MLENDMGLFDDRSQKTALSAHLSQLADGLGKLVTHHLQLLRLELTDDARVIGGNAARIAAFVPFVLVGYALLCVALAVFLSGRLGLDGALALVGGVNLLGGAAGIVWAGRKIRARSPLSKSLAELEASAAALKPNGKALMESNDAR